MQTQEIQPGWVLATLLAPIVWAYVHQFRRRFYRRGRNSSADAIRRVAAGQNFATAPRQPRPRRKETIDVR